MNLISFFFFYPLETLLLETKKQILELMNLSIRVEMKVETVTEHQKPFYI